MTTERRHACEPGRLTPGWLVFEDPLSRRLLEQIERLGPTEVTTLLLGETGTGKEMIARRLHELSSRASQPFVAVNCGALTETLVDGELFGHERGAFTGAVQAKSGWFEAAQGGTIFLDEIGDLPPSIQVKLLRVLQQREIVRLGSRQSTPIDVRVIAATNVDLEAAVAAGRFREDLFYRLSVAVLRIPPLRDRPGDIPRLTETLLRAHAVRLGIDVPRLDSDALGALQGHRWPGNVRELENVLHRALLTSRGGRITVVDLELRPGPAPLRPLPLRPVPETAALERALRDLFERNLPDLHARVEEVLIRTAYQFCERNQLATARLLGISRNVVRARLIECGALPPPVRDTAPSVGSHGRASGLAARLTRAWTG